ncbi:MAG: hypothetical protein LC808_06710, partial [Actinobacteria bacterium]|nr:hypothetical protein [Actinomycetota bacterium]
TSILAKSRVIDPAGLDSRSPVRALAFNVVTGIIGALALGAGWVVVRELTSERVGRPVEVSRALGTAVPVRVGKLGGRRRRRHFRRHLTRPKQEVAQVVAHLRRSAGVNSVTVPKLAVLSIGCDGAAAMALACTALEYADQGKTVLIADFSGASELANLFRIRAGETATLRPGGVSAPIRVTFPLLQAGGDTVPLGSPGAMTESGDDRPDAVLVLAKLDPAVGALHLVDWVTAVVAMVAKGQCTITDLRVTSEMIEGSGLIMDSAILVGVDRNEKGLSMLPAATSNRSRAEPLLGPTP